MSLRSIVCFGVLVVFLAGCATQYKKFGLLGGYFDHKIEPGLHYILVSGNGFTQRASVGEMMLLRAAELTVKDGYTRFILFHDRKNDNEAVAAIKRKKLRPHLIRRLEAEGTKHNQVVVQEENTTLTSQYLTTVITKPGSSMMALMLRSGDRYFGNGVDARAVIAMLQAKYRKPS